MPRERKQFASEGERLALQRTYGYSTASAIFCIRQLLNFIKIHGHNKNIYHPDAPGACGNNCLSFFLLTMKLQSTAEPGKMRLGSVLNKSTETLLFSILFDCSKRL